MDPTAALIAGYLAFHFLAYALVLRRMAYFRTETGIFLAHALSYPALACAVAARSLLGHEGAALAAPHVALALSLHGIYSLSFLELWSLTQGSYSLSILERVARSRSPATRQSVAPLGELGPRKRTARDSALYSIGLLRPHGDAGMKLTAAGRACARLIRFLLWFSGGRALN